VNAAEHHTWLAVDLVPALRSKGDARPHDGAIAALDRLIGFGFDVVIVSERSRTLSGRQITDEWLAAHHLPPLKQAFDVTAYTPRVNVHDLAFLLACADNPDLVESPAK
jgi:hypothetical protein